MWEPPKIAMAKTEWEEKVVTWVKKDVEVGDVGDE